MKCVVSIISLVAFCLTASAADPLPVNRKMGFANGWNGKVGVPGGIPARSTIYASFNPGATTAQIQSALNSCPSNQVVFLNAGTYSVGSLFITRNGVTLRGAGQNSTILNITGGNGLLIGTTAWWNEFERPVAANHRAWTSGHAQGSTTITVSSTSGLSVGNLIFLDQLNDVDTTAYSPVNPAGPFVTGEYTSIAYPLKGMDRIQFQVNRVAAISGNTITLTEPIYMPNWTPALSPEIWFETQPSLTCNSGVEDMRINVGGGGSTCVLLQYTYSCWVKNCYLSMLDTSHIGYVFMNMCVRPEVRHNYMHDTGVADRYGIHTRIVGGALVEDNIIDAHSTMLMVNGVSGSVYAYNFGVNLQLNTGFMVSGITTHGGTPNMCLFEGNYSPQFALDSQWQNSSYLVAFRNRHTGKDELNLATGNIQAIGIFYTNRHASVIGCVLGKTGVHNVYEVSGASAGNCYDGRRIFYLGYEAGGAGCNGVYDPVVKSSLVRAVNWTSATTTNNGINLDGYAVSDIPSSYYLTSKPAFFGNLTWPPVDPTNPNDSFIRTNIPAGYRYVNGIDPPGSSAKPSPPSNLRVVGP